uniref:Uncharacterized protein n=1 Tax=Daphnia magna TaxID=35525 RepID=A0A0P5XJW9_9CRUS
MTAARLRLLSGNELRLQQLPQSSTNLLLTGNGLYLHQLSHWLCIVSHEHKSIQVVMTLNLDNYSLLTNNNKG